MLLWGEIKQNLEVSANAKAAPALGCEQGASSSVFTSWESVCKDSLGCPAGLSAATRVTAHVLCPQVRGAALAGEPRPSPTPDTVRPSFIFEQFSPSVSLASNLTWVTTKLEEV